jgi:putative ABC transport system permease protein
MLSALSSDLRLALRAMRRQPAFTAVVVGTLALGIGANTAMFGLIHAALLKPLPYSQPERLVLARRTVAGRPQLLHSAPDYYDYREQAPGFEALAATTPGAFQTTITGNAKPERVPATAVSYDLFSTLGVAPVAGRAFTADEDRAGAPYVVMVSERLANRRFGSAAAALGRTLTVSGIARSSAVATIVGVMPGSYRFLEQADLWVPRRRGEGDGPRTRMFHNWVLVGRLKPGLTLDAAQRQVDVVSGRLQQQYPETNKEKAMRLEPLQGALFQEQTPILLILMGAVGLVLLVACANVAGLLVARGVARRGELAVRAAIGASRGRIAMQLVTETLVLAGVAGLAGVALAVWLQRLLPIATGLSEMGVEARGVETPVLLFALAASLVTGLLSGVAPAVRASSLRLAEHLAPGTRATDSRGGARLRTVLVIGQVAISLVLLVGAGLLLRSLGRLMALDLGFNSQGLQVTAIDIPYQDEARRIQFLGELRDDLSAIPGVSDVTMASHMPIREPYGDPPMWPAKRPPVDSTQERTALSRVVMPGYFRTLGIPLVAGRDLAPSDRQGTPRVIVVNGVMAREFFPGENPLGQKVMVAGDPAPMDFEVVGVVGDARIGSAGDDVMAAAYVSAHQRGLRRANVILRSQMAPASLTRAVAKLLASKDPDIPIDPLASMGSIIDESLLPRRVTAITLTAFSAVALLLAAIGLYGVLAYYVTQRTHEIGIRIALGAGAGVVLGHVMRRSAMMVGPGLAIGIVASAACARVVEGFLYDVPPTDPATYAGVSLCLAAVAFAASAWPALRAARIDPVRALRGE